MYLSNQHLSIVLGASKAFHSQVMISQVWPAEWSRWRCLDGVVTRPAFAGLLLLGPVQPEVSLPESVAPLLFGRVCLELGKRPGLPPFAGFTLAVLVLVPEEIVAVVTAYFFTRSYVT